MDCDIELEIGPGSAQGEYTVHVVRAPAGGHGSGSFMLDVGAILARRAELEATILASSVAARRTTPIMELPVRAAGQELFQSLFTREVYGTYRASLGAAQHAGQQVRLVLRLAAPELAALPWEMLFDPETESYLCQTEPLLRHIPAADYHPNPLDITPPLRILGIAAAPRDLPALDAEAEKRNLANALAGPVAEGRVELVWAPSGTWDAVQSSLLAGPWHAVHFIGHGDYDYRSDEGRIAMEDPDGRSAMVRAVRFMALLSVAAPRPRLVVLNSCASGEMSRADLFSGTAASLVRSGINAVAAMQFAISDSAAIAFAHGFYAAVANGRAVDEAARVGRISVMASPDGTLEWVTPALYVRGGSTQLFTLAPLAKHAPPGPAPAPTPAPPPPPEAALQNERTRQAQLRALYVQAGAELRVKNFGVAAELFEDLLTLEPGYRDAESLRDSAVHRQQLAEQYRLAREAEDAQEWGAAAEAFALLDGEEDYPDAGARRRECEHRQRVADLQSELRYHFHGGSWQAVVDVAVELEALDHQAADPQGLTTAARSELRKLAELQKERAARDERAAKERAEARERPVPEAPPTIQKPAVQKPAVQRPPVQEPPAPEPAPTVPRVPAAGPSARPWEAWLGFAGGLLLAMAGITGASAVTEYYWYVYKMDSGAIPLALALGLLIPAALVAMAAAGVPTRAVPGRILMSAAAVFSALLGWGGLARLPEATAVFLTGAQCVCAVLLVLVCLREPMARRLAGWILGLSLAAVVLVWNRSNPLAFQLSYFIPVTIAGVTAAWASQPWQARPAQNPPGHERPAPVRPAQAQPETPSAPLNPAMLRWAGILLLAAGPLGLAFLVYFLVTDDANWWYWSGSSINQVRLAMGLVGPAGLLLLLAAGLPDTTRRGRQAMALIAVGNAAFAWFGFDDKVAAATVAASLVQAGAGVWAGSRALRNPSVPSLGAWALMLAACTVVLVWIPSPPFLLAHSLAVLVAGILFLVLAGRVAARRGTPK
ncbi:CHAT domain-containing protein [Arthrobacter celericrescens]|uniref:CHAT domain-containing protein n=1 Tax=Arthrobacter celericrescens TaxID=2320851 RepID=UPI0013C4C480|nr:CHAT domain-containing protein [Arthrobacter celericrescens]